MAGLYNAYVLLHGSWRRLACTTSCRMLEEGGAMLLLRHHWTLVSLPGNKLSACTISSCKGNHNSSSSSTLITSAPLCLVVWVACQVSPGTCLSLKRQLYMQNWVHYALCKTRLLFMSFRLIMSVVQLLLMHDLLCFLHSGMLSLLLLLHSRFCAVTPKMKHSAAYVTKPHMKNCLQIQPCCLCLQLTQKAINNA